MAREVSVKITANTSGFNSGMTAAGNKAKQTAKGIADAFDSGLDFVGKNKRKIDTLGSAFGGIGLVAAVGVGAAVKSAADFDKAMSGVAATGADARASLGALRDAAIQAGADTKFSASDAAGGIEALAKAGVSAQDALGGGLSGALNLAAAGNQSVGESAETAASAMNQFGLSGRDVPHIADLLAQSAGTAQGEVSDMAAALNQSGLVANQFGLSIDETSQALALFAKNGLVGSDAGTSFKTMLTSLYAPTGQGAKALTALGVSAYDASGQLKPIGVLADDLKGKLDGLTAQDRNQALKNIFGSDALRTGTILLNQGSAGLSQMAADFGKFGSAADVARLKMDNLSGDLEQFKGSAETALIGLGESGTGPLRTLTQGATDAVNAFNDLGDGTKSTVLGVAGGLASVALSAAGIGKVAVFANEAKTALKGLGVTAKGAGLATAGISAGIGLAALAFGAYASHAAEVKAKTDDFTTALQSQTSAIQANVTATAAKQLQEAGALQAAQSLGLGLDTVTQAALGNAKAYDQVQAAIVAARAAGENSSNVDDLQRLSDANLLAQAVRGTGSAYNQAVNDAKDFASATGAASASVGVDAYTEAAGALDAISSSSAGAASDLTALSSALFDTSNAALAVSDAQIGFEAAVDGAAAAAKKNGENLKVNTAAGRENKTALNQLAAAGQKYVEQLAATGTSSKEVKRATEDARGEFVKQATAMTGSASKAKDLADAAGLIPKDVVTTYEAKTGDAKAGLAKVNDAIKDLPKDKQVEVRSAYKSGGIEAAKAKLAEIKDKTVTATARGQAQGAKTVDRALKSLDDRVVYARVKADTSGATAARRALATVNNKVVTVTIQRRGDRGDADGGYIDSTFPGYDVGGRIRGAGGPRQDNVMGLDRRSGVQTSWVSVGEFVTNAKSYANNAGVVETINANPSKQFNIVEAATGGYISGLRARGLASGGPVGLTTDREILRAVTAQFHVDQAKNLNERRQADKELAKAMKKLNDTQTAALDSIKSLSTSLQEPYRSKSTDVDDVLASLQDGAKDLTAFGAQIKGLKALGLDQAVIDQITADGAINGGELAAQILAGGRDLVKSLNTANEALVKAGTVLGETSTGLASSAKPKKKKASGGYISGPGSGTSDSISALLSNGEFVVNSEATARNRSVLEAINYGRARINEHRFMPAYAGRGGSVQQSAPSNVHMGDVVLSGDFGGIDRALAAARSMKRDNLTMARLSTGL